MQRIQDENRAQQDRMWQDLQQARKEHRAEQAQMLKNLQQAQQAANAAKDREIKALEDARKRESGILQDLALAKDKQKKAEENEQVQRNKADAEKSSAEYWMKRSFMWMDYFNKK